MFSIEDTTGKPIAYIRGGKYNGEIIYIHDDNKKIVDENSSSESESSSDSLIDIPTYNQFINTKMLNGGTFEAIPLQSSREINYVAGKSGSGKSTYISLLLQKYIAIDPKKIIYLFSMKDSDPVLDKYRNVIRIPINNNLVDNPVNIQTDIKKDTVVIFDDVNPQTITDKKLRSAIEKLKLDILEYGRSSRIDLICSSHLINPNDRSFGRVIMNELHNLIIFKNGSSAHQALYALTHHLGYSKIDADKILCLGIRWIMISNTLPEYILTEKECIISKALPKLNIKK